MGVARRKHREYLTLAAGGSERVSRGEGRSLEALNLASGYHLALKDAKNQSRSLEESKTACSIWSLGVSHSVTRGRCSRFTSQLGAALDLQLDHTDWYRPVVKTRPPRDTSHSEIRTNCSGEGARRRYINWPALRWRSDHSAHSQLSMIAMN
jgi:hypothetical protein